MQCYRLSSAGADAVDAFVDFEVVVWGEERDGFVYVWVFEDGGGDAVEGASASSRLCDYSFD